MTPPEPKQRPKVRVVDKRRTEAPSAPTAPTAQVEELPVLPLQESVLFPGLALPVTVAREASLRLIEQVAGGDRMLATATLKAPLTPDAEGPASPEALFEVGTSARIAELLRLPTGATQIAVQGLTRVRFIEWVSRDPFLVARVQPLEETPPTERAQALLRTVLTTFRRVAEMAPYIPPQFAVAAMNVRDPGDLADLLSANLNIAIGDKQRLLEELDVERRLEELDSLLNQELGLLELSIKAQQELSQDVQRMQREQFLRRQLEVIRKELGETDEQSGEIEELRQKVRESGMPDSACAAAERELARLDRMQRGSPEETVTRTYIQWLVDVPWTKQTTDNGDLDHAKTVLDADHHGLDKVKDRILEYLAVTKLRPDRRSPILCFSGPPGVGKTSLGQSIAKALGRSFVRMSLGGVRDEAEIRGHRRTYVGALPGRIVQGLHKAGSINPVMMLDEIDKLGADFRGDPSAALLEVLDPEQNHSFSDHYLEVPIDLSRVMFICTANFLDAIPGPLRDRMEIIELRGYTEPEKLDIAKHHLLPRQLVDHGLTPKRAAVSDDALRRLVREYTSEAGVRNLERQIASVLRKVARRIAAGETKKVTVRGKDLDEMLGPPLIRGDIVSGRDEVGVATGLAWTPVGGDILFVEAVLVPGKGSFVLTGQLGDVMKESARAGLTYARSRSAQIGAPENWYDDYEVHVHVPAGAIPKDGPSAGVTMVVAMVSAITRNPVRRRVAMTGEITLRGKVLPVGGIKEKVIAAHRSGVKTVILPRDNEPDLRDVPDLVRKDLRFVLVEHMDEVLREALVKPVTALKPAELVSPSGTVALRGRASAKA